MSRFLSEEWEAGVLLEYVFLEAERPVSRCRPAMLSASAPARPLPQRLSQQLVKVVSADLAPG
jgi:hypothetical protein